MIISALVLTVHEPLQSHVIEALSVDCRFMLGQPQGGLLPVVLETPHIAQSVEVVERELTALPGVLGVHVVQIDFDDVDYSQEPTMTRQRRAGRELELAGQETNSSFEGEEDLWR